MTIFLYVSLRLSFTVLLLQKGKMSPRGRENGADLAPLIESVNDDSDEIVIIGRQPPRAARGPQILATVIACLAPISMGLTLGFSAPTTQELKTSLNLEQMSWYGSLITVGAIAGGPIAAILIEKAGRKKTIMMCNLPFSVGWFLLMYASDSDYIMLYCGRLLTGLGMGMCSLATPVYIAEISTKEWRGTLGASFQLAVTLGILGVYALGKILDRHWLAIACQCVPAIMIIAMLPLPETPCWYLSKGERLDAISALRWFRGPVYDIEAECLDIDTTLALQKQTNVTFADLIKSKPFWRPLIISIGLMIFQQCSGINNIIFYTSRIFDTAGFSDPNLTAIIIGSVLVVATMISVLLMDIAGRRILLIVAAIFMTLSSCSLGLFYYGKNVLGWQDLSWLSLCSVIVFIIFFSLGWGPIPWLIMSEIFPTRAKGLATGIATLVNWTNAFLITKEFTALETAVDDYGAFWAFGGMCFLSLIFVAFLVPETKGKMLEDIEQYFEETRVLCI